MSLKTIHLADKPFLTLQGEGPSVGRPAYFIRVQGCSVGCDFCDTKYSWSEDPTKGFLVSHLDIQKELMGIPLSTIIVVTGGEPFEHVESLCDLFDSIDTGIHSIEVETSGYIFDRNLLSAVDRVILSPKVLPSSLVREEKRMSDTIADTWRTYDKRLGGVFWKFVIRDQNDFDACMEKVFEWKLPKRNVYLMPEAITEQQNMERGRWLAEMCKTWGFNLSLRTHISLWGAKRGV